MSLATPATYSGAGVQRDDVQRRAGLVVQHRAQHLDGLLRAVHAQVAAGRHGDAEVLRVDLVLAHLAVAQLADQGAGAQRDLVHVVAAPDHHGALGAQLAQHARLDAHQIGMEHAHQHRRRAGRIGQRAEDVEDGAHAHLAAHRRDHLHRRMMDRREHEADAGLLDGGGHLLRLQFDHRAQRFQRVGAAGLGRHAAVAVLGHARTGGGGHEHRAGGDVEGVRAIATGADDIDQVGGIGHRHWPGEFAHHGGRRGDLVHGLLLHAQAGEDRRGHHRRHVAAHDLPHQVDHFVEEDFAVLDGAMQGFLGEKLMGMLLGSGRRAAGNCAAGRGRVR
jgi:hypothetical protein